MLPCSWHVEEQWDGRLCFPWGHAQGCGWVRLVSSSGGGDVLRAGQQSPWSSAGRRRMLSITEGSKLLRQSIARGGREKSLLASQLLGERQGLGSKRCTPKASTKQKVCWEQICPDSSKGGLRFTGIYP